MTSSWKLNVGRSPVNSSRCLGILLIILLLLPLANRVPRVLSASESIQPAGSDAAGVDTFAWLDDIDVRWGGHVKIRGVVSWPDSDSIYGVGDDAPFSDGNAELRVKNTLFFSDSLSLETHYETVYSVGDTLAHFNDLGYNLVDFLIPGAPLNDDRRLMDLTDVITSGSRSVWYQRIDRLVLTAEPSWGLVRIGRQALTWGNGLIFNPMDLANPFAPTDIQRDYKIGDDMALVQVFSEDAGNLQGIIVPRREPGSGDLKTTESTAAGKLHRVWGSVELDAMAAYHYNDLVMGVGGTGTLGEAAWRMDLVLSTLGDDRNGFASLVANMDRSWVWFGKNFYGLVELYFNGLGKSRPAEALSDPEVFKRLARGDMFTLGRYYLNGAVQVELHPLLNLFVSAINNLEDPSGVVQPRVVWDFAPDFQATLGMDFYWGARGTEYGGFALPGSDLLVEPPPRVYLWLSWFF